MGTVKAMYKNKYRLYPDRFDLPNRAKTIDGFHVHISKLKTMMIDGVSYYYGNINGLIHFYPKASRYFNAEKMTEFVNSFELPIIPEEEKCVGDYGLKYSGYFMTYDTFMYLLPSYIYFVEQIKSHYKKVYGENITFRQYTEG